MSGSDTNVDDRLDCMNRNMARLRPDIRQIIHEEMKAVVEETLARYLKALDHYEEEEKVRRRERCW